MTYADYLLTALASFIAIGSWTLFTSARAAVDGFEDEFGFHFGITPPLAALYPALVQSAYFPAELARAAVPTLTKKRRKSGSKPPMLPTDLHVDDLNPQPASKAQAHPSKKSKTGESSLPQIPSSSDQPPAP
jgi:hypothetical protein